MITYQFMKIRQHTLVSKMDYSLEFELLGKYRFSCCV
jgi:hypothetical protein